MTIQKGSPFLRVSHTGQTTGSLLLADLADEENTKENRKIPVYVPENGFIDLPFEEDVLLSYQQGTIRGLEDQGYVSTTVIDDGGGLPIAWVSKDGADTNPGTRNAPYRNIQTAIDTLVEDFGHDVSKEVHLLDNLDSISNADQVDTTFIRTRNLTIKGHGQDRIRYQSSIEPLFVVTNMTDAGWDAFQSDGGLSYTISTAEYTPTHASLVDRDIDPDLSVNTDWNIRFENLTMFGFHTNGVNGGGTPVIAVFSESTGTDVSVSNIFFHDCDFYANNGAPTLYLRSCEEVIFSDCKNLVSTDTTTRQMVMENSLDTRFRGPVEGARFVFYFDSTDDLIPPATTRRAIGYNSETFDFDTLLVDFDGDDPRLKNCDIREYLRIQTNVTLFNCSVNNLEGNGTATMEGGGYYGTNSATVSHTPLQTT